MRARTKSQRTLSDVSAGVTGSIIIAAGRRAEAALGAMRTGSGNAPESRASTRMRTNVSPSSPATRTTSVPGLVPRCIARARRPARRTRRGRARTCSPLLACAAAIVGEPDAATLSIAFLTAAPASCTIWRADSNCWSSPKGPPIAVPSALPAIGRTARCSAVLRSSAVSARGAAHAAGLAPCSAAGRARSAATTSPIALFQARSWFSARKRASGRWMRAHTRRASPVASRDL